MYLESVKSSVNAWSTNAIARPEAVPCMATSQQFDNMQEQLSGIESVTEMKKIGRHFCDCLVLA